MIFSPFVNAITDKLPKLTMDTWREYLVVVPLLFMVWIWGHGRMLPYGSKILPDTDGLMAYGGITLVGIYTATRAFKASGLIDKIQRWHLAVAIPILCVLMAIGFNNYNSPVAFALALSTFVVIKRLSIPSGMRKVVIFLGPSMFSVFLLHANKIGFSSIKMLSKTFIEDYSINYFAVCFIVPLIIFVIALIFDLPRRIYLKIM